MRRLALSRLDLALATDDTPGFWTAVAHLPASLFDEHAIVRGLWRGIDVFRWLALAYAAWSAWERHEQITHLALAVAVNLALLVAFKYANFLAVNVNTMLLALHAPPLVVAPLPVRGFLTLVHGAGSG